MILIPNLLESPDQLLAVLIERLFRDKPFLKEFLLLFVIRGNLIELAHCLFLFFIDNKPATTILLSPANDLLYRLFPKPSKDLIIIAKLFEDG